MSPAPPARLRILVPITGAFHGKVRVRRAGTLDTEGLQKVLSAASLQALAVAKQVGNGAELVAVHIDLGEGEQVLREALAHGLDQGILLEGAGPAPDASTRAALLAEVYRQSGPFDAVIGPAVSEFSGFSGALAALAGALELPCAVGVSRLEADGRAFRIGYQSIFGDYELRVPRPCVIVAGDVAPSHPTASGIHDAYRVRGILRVRADGSRSPLTRRVRIEPIVAESRSPEEVDAATLVRRIRSRGLGGGP